MDQKRLKVFKERLLSKKQEILEAYNKNKSYGKEADGEATQDIADKAANSYTKEFLFSLSTCCRRSTTRSRGSMDAASGSAPCARRT